MKKNKSFARQAIKVSPKQLREMADDLEKEINSDLFIRCMNEVGDLKFLVSIINKTPKCSDTWEFETGEKKQMGKTIESVVKAETPAPAPVKRGRGRPRKNPQ